MFGHNKNRQSNLGKRRQLDQSTKFNPSQTSRKWFTEFPTVVCHDWYWHERLIELPVEVFKRNWWVKYAYDADDPTKVHIQFGGTLNAPSGKIFEPPADNTGGYEWLHSLERQLASNRFESFESTTGECGKYADWAAYEYLHRLKRHSECKEFESRESNTGEYGRFKDGEASKPKIRIEFCELLLNKSKYELMADLIALDEIYSLFAGPSHPLQMLFLEKFCNVSYPQGSRLSTGITYYSKLLPYGGIPGFHLLIGYDYNTLFQEFDNYNRDFDNIVDINSFMFFKLIESSMELEESYKNDIELGLPSVLQMKSHFKCIDLYELEDIYVNVLYPSFSNMNNLTKDVLVYIGKSPMPTKFCEDVMHYMFDCMDKSINECRCMTNYPVMIRPASIQEISQYLTYSGYYLKSSKNKLLNKGRGWRRINEIGSWPVLAFASNYGAIATSGWLPKKADLYTEFAGILKDFMKYKQIKSMLDIKVSHFTSAEIKCLSDVIKKYSPVNIMNDIYLSLAKRSKMQLLNNNNDLHLIKKLFIGDTNAWKMVFLTKFCNIAYPKGSCLSTGITYYSKLLPYGGIPGFHLLIAYNYITLFKEYYNYNYDFDNIVDINSFMFFKLIESSMELEESYKNDIELGLPSVLQMKSHFKCIDLYELEDIYVNVLYPSFSNMNNLTKDVLVYIGKSPMPTKFCEDVMHYMFDCMDKSINECRCMTNYPVMIRPANIQEISQYLT